VELALCMEQRAQAAGVRQVDVQVVHSSAGLLPGSARSLRRRIEREFQRRGVGHHGGERVTEVREDAVVLEGGTRFGADLVVWVTGAASHLDASLGGPLTRQGWIPVGDTLQHVEHAGVFAAGDCAQLVDHPDLPKAGVYSVRMGPVLSHNLRAAASAGNGVMKSYHPQDDFLALLNLGDGRAAGSKWGRSFSGRWVMRWKDRIDRAFVSRYR
jgi:NADH dehydrogenase FAD-containing subunit